MFNQLKQDALEVLQIVLDDVLKDVLLKGPIVSETRRKLQAARELAEDCLDRLLQAVDKTLQSNQLTLSREVVPYIQEVMVPAYEATLAETGRGSLARRRVSTTILDTRLDQADEPGLYDTIREYFTLSSLRMPTNYILDQPKFSTRGYKKRYRRSRNQ